jgi:TonB family protein
MGEEQEERFRKLLVGVLIATLILCIVIPLLPVPEPEPYDVEELPPRFARLLLEKPVPPPPPPPPQVEKPQESVKEPDRVVPEQKPEPVVEQPREQAREKAATAGLLPFAEDLAALRDDAALENVLNNDLNQSAGEAERVERSIIASNATSSSGGIKTSGMSRDTGGGGLGERTTTKVMSPVAGMGDAGPKVQKGGSAPSRSREEIELIFDKNKGSIFALYNRALRRDPTLQGKVVLELTIDPSGVVSNCKILSSELNDPDLERKLIQRVKLFKFEAKDVATVTTTKPIDFFPA